MLLQSSRGEQALPRRVMTLEVPLRTRRRRASVTADHKLQPTRSRTSVTGGLELQYAGMQYDQAGPDA